MVGFASRVKRALLRLAGKEGDAVVVTFLSGPDELALAMLDEVRQLLPDREHWAVSLMPRDIQGVRCVTKQEASHALRRKRIGLAPVLFANTPEHEGLRRLAWRTAPHKILAYNSRLERHHLRPSTFLASWLFLRGVPLDRIWLRPSWLVPWKHDRSIYPVTHTVYTGRARSNARRLVGVLSPYFPYPLSHGGAVRMYNLLSEASREFDIVLFTFAGRIAPEDREPVLAFCAKAIAVPPPRYREPRWSTLLPPEVREFYSPTMARLIADENVPLLQVEYTQLARYGGHILVEHDVTFDLYAQIHEREGTLSSWWDLFRWRRFERHAVRRFPRVVVMSGKDAKLLESPATRVVPNGVDLSRFTLTPEIPGSRLLFIGSFRHFPNMVAYRWFVEEIWPRLRDVQLTVVAGPDCETYWSAQYAGPIPRPAGSEFHGFVRDVTPLYKGANLVVAPTRVSAGTNLKVLEAMAAGRAVVSTTSGCAGLGLEHGRSVWIGDTAEAFADGITQLLADNVLRHSISQASRALAEQHFDWRRLGKLQVRVWSEFLPDPVRIRPGAQSDLAAIADLQRCSPDASQWRPMDYLAYILTVAELNGTIAGFLVTRQTAPGEVEILNVAVHPEFRRSGIATRLIQSTPKGSLFLEVRESNSAARELYKSLDFEEIGRREKYYADPVETAVLMRLSR